MSDKLTAERLRALDEKAMRGDIKAAREIRDMLFHNRAAILAMAEARDLLETDVRFWKRIADERSEHMRQLSLDRAAMGVENARMREALAFYADPSNLECWGVNADDFGTVANRALGKDQA